MNRKSTSYLTDTALLAAFCLFLSLIEYMIPKPMPFMRLGLAHLPVMLSLTIFPPKRTLLLTLLKVLGQGLVNGTLFSYIFLFSAAGSFSSVLVMLAVYRLLRGRVSLVGVSVAGAMASNSVQILLARQFIFGDSALLIAPPFLAVGIVSSVLLGLFAAEFSSKSEWMRTRIKNAEQEPGSAEEADLSPPEGKAGFLPRFAFICGVISIPAFLLQDGTLIVVSEAVIFIILSIIAGKRFRPLPVIFMTAGIAVANLLTPYGRILFRLGDFNVTEGALLAGVEKAAVLIGMIYISRFSLRKGLSFPGRLGSLLSRVFFYFGRLTSGRRIERRNIIEQLDLRIIELSGMSASEIKNPENRDSGSGAVDYFLALLPPLISCGAFAVTGFGA